MKSNYKSEFPIFKKLQTHYLDNAAMTQTPQCVIDSIVRFETSSRTNINRGLYPLADQATEEYEEARREVARFINADNASEIVFTSGTTLSINIIAQAICDTLSPGDEILLSKLEHHSNVIPWLIAARQKDLTVKFIPLTADGRLDLSSLNNQLTRRCRIIALTHASNVTGAVTDIETIVSAAQSVGAYVLLDGAQAIGHECVDVKQLNVDFYTFSGHKLFAPTGVGVLWGRQELLNHLSPTISGGGSIKEITTTTFSKAPHKFEAGTPPIAQAVGLSSAIKWFKTLNRDQISNDLKDLTTKLYKQISSLPGISILGPDPQQYHRLPIVSFYSNEIHPHDFCQILADNDIAVRGGHHCAQPLIEAYNISGTTRASLALYNDLNDINALCRGLEKALDLLT